MPNKNVIVAVDGSKEADQVVRVAKEIASDGSLTLMTVTQPMAYAYDLEPGGPLSNYSSIEEEFAKAAAVKLDALAERHNLTCDKLTPVGQPAHEIRKIAKESDADLIVIGSHGRHGLGLLLGSTANGVLHGAPCSVFVVRIR